MQINFSNKIVWKNKVEKDCNKIIKCISNKWNNKNNNYTK